MSKKYKLEKEDYSRPFVGVGAIVLKRDKEGNEYVLLGKRKSVAGEGCWHVPGGHLKMDERFSEAVEREVKEETGLDVKVKRVLWVEENFAYLHHVNLYFEAELLDPKQEPKNLEPEKCYEWRWFRTDNLPSPLWTLEEFFKFYNNRERIKRFGKIARDWIGLGVIAAILDSNNRILLLKRKNKGGKEVDRWEFPGGKVEYKEGVEDALIREMKEELGVEVLIESFLFNLENYIDEEGEYWFAPVYICRIKKGKIKNMEPNKFEGFKFFELDNIPKNSVSGVYKIVSEVKKYLLKNS